MALQPCPRACAPCPPHTRSRQPARPAHAAYFSTWLPSAASISDCASSASRKPAFIARTVARRTSGDAQDQTRVAGEMVESTRALDEVIARFKVGPTPEDEA